MNKIEVGVATPGLEGWGAARAPLENFGAKENARTVPGVLRIFCDCSLRYRLFAV
jgi:hypothetical protein